MIELGLLAVIVTLAGLYEYRTGITAKAVQAERKAWAAERAALLNRIKPETAQVVPGALVEERPAVNLDDDEDYWKAQQEALERVADMEHRGLTEVIG